MTDRTATTRRAMLKAFPMFGVAAVAASVPAAEAAPTGALEPLVWPEDRMVMGSHPVPTPVERMEVAMADLRRAMATYMADKEGTCSAVMTHKPGSHRDRSFVIRVYRDANKPDICVTENIIDMRPA